MCRTCRDVVGLDAKAALDAIAAIMKGAKNSARVAEHFKPILDKLLGTNEPETNTEADGAFERAYRNR